MTKHNKALFRGDVIKHISCSLCEWNTERKKLDATKALKRHLRVIHNISYNEELGKTLPKILTIDGRLEDKGYKKIIEEERKTAKAMTEEMIEEMTKEMSGDEIALLIADLDDAVQGVCEDFGIKA